MNHGEDKEVRLISKTTLLRVYRCMKGNPLKVFLVSDFDINNARVHLKTLEALGLVERVNAVLRSKYNVDNRMAWRLIRRKCTERCERRYFYCSYPNCLVKVSPYQLLEWQFCKAHAKHGKEFLHE